jgi:hypothetical protein
MWNQLSPGSKRFVGWLGFVSGIFVLLFAAVLLISGETNLDVLFLLLSGVLWIADSAGRPKSILRPPQ